MDDLGRFFQTLSRLRAETFGVQAFHALKALLALIDAKWQTSLVARFDRHHDEIQNGLHSDPGFSSALRQIFEAYQDDLLFDGLLGDPTTLVDFNILVAFLAEDFPTILPEPTRSETQCDLEQLQPRVASDLISAVAEQGHVLANAIWRVKQFLTQRLDARGRAILLEFPVGNSLPTRVLARVPKREGISAEVVQVALSRNDSQRRGITRRELLERRLTDAGVKSADVVVLLDEWVSGSNFRNLVGLLRKIPEVREASFLPVGLLTTTSSTSERFDSHVDAHNKLIESLGETGDAYRFLFPPVASKFEREGYFFWSENDRLAGYRKLQTFGAYLSAIDATIDRIRTDPATRRRAHAEVVAQIEDTPGYGGVGSEAVAEIVGDGGVADRMFEKSVRDYEQCRVDVQQIVVSTAKGEEADIEAEINEAVTRFHQIVDPRPAKI